MYTYKIVNSYPHDREAFTQGLFYEDGVFLYEAFFLDQETAWAVGTNGTILYAGQPLSVEGESRQSSLNQPALFQSFPNPFRVATNIHFQLPAGISIVEFTHQKRLSNNS